jgi:MoxR-like ATPase
MGETGIGKTSLVKLMAKIMETPIKIFNINAGVTSKEIEDYMNLLELEAAQYN